MSPSHFRTFILPYLKRSIDAAHEMGVPYIKHTDGNIWAILDMLVEADIDAIDPIEPLAGMDIGEVKARYGDRMRSSSDLAPMAERVGSLTMSSHRGTRSGSPWRRRAVMKRS